MKRTSIIMKAIAIAMISVGFNAFANASTIGTEKVNIPQGDKIFTQEETMPSFPGGTQKLIEYINDNLQYPKDCKESCIEGRVIVTFFVEIDGSLSDIKVIRSLHPSMDAEAVRLVKTMPKWNPGSVDGKVVRKKFTMPVSFKLK